MTLAFRLYGRFRWPPSPTKVETAVKSGVVDVHFLPSIDGKQRAALRWTPREDIPPISDETEPKPESIQPEDAVAYLGETVDAKTIWLDAESKADWLAFRGAFLIEQYRNDGRKPILSLRLPLANDISYSGKDDEKVFSGLRVIAGGLFELRLNFPLPVEQSKTSPMRSFPIAAQYKAKTSKASDDPLLLSGFLAGWSKEYADKNGKFGGTRKELSKLGGATEFRLGGFGFSERGAGAATAGFVSYNENHLTIGDYWPENAERFAEDLLGRYGFEVGDDSWLKYSENEPADLSLRFGPSNSLATSMIYRIRAKALTDNTGGNQEICPVNVGTPKTPIYYFKLRLTGELGGTVADAIYYRSDEVDGWLHLGDDRLSADCEVSWDIGDDAVWSDNPTHDWSPKVALRLHWQENVLSANAEEVKGTSSLPGGTVFSGALLKQANFTFNEARDAMLAGEAGLPHSFLPTLSIKSQTVRFMLHGSPVAASINDSGLLSWGRPGDRTGKPLGSWKRPPMRLTLADPDKLIRDAPEAKDQTKLTVTADGMTFFRNPATKFSLDLVHDPDWPPTSVDSVEDGPPFFASFTAVTRKAENKWDGRLASLGFNADAALDTSKQDGNLNLRGHLRIGGKGARDGYGSGGAELIYPGGRVATEFRMVIPVSAISPVSVDVSRFDHTGRAAPLLIPLPNEGETKSEGRYWLSATETLSARHDRQLRADIIEDTPDAGERSYAVLSSEPFSVFRFTQQPLSDRGSADSASVAVYSGDDRIWQFRKVSQYYHYTLPPQSIGESADKPRRLEIHDLPESKAGEVPLEDPPRPYAMVKKKDENGNDVLDHANGLRRRAVEQRLTPPAEIWIAPSDVERGYFMPEATSYEIFRQTGAYGLGAALAFLRAEFLYGMPVGIDVSKEGGIARGARVAEIEALVGQLVGDARETNADHRLSSRWNALRAAVARRPERLEVWARDLGSMIDFTPAKFSDGVRFALRGTALHRPALIDRTIEGAVTEDPNNWPKVGVTTPVYAENSGDKTGKPEKPRTHPQGLSGGALWPVESLNLLNTLLENPESVGGTIEQIALSPLGGDAAQKGSFLSGQVAIISETRNGRVQRMQVEVIGRICALWHRAKHVVVYERTVNPSAQFAPKFDEDPDRTRSRRPILRKVREYVELLQPVRGYPDFNIATQRSAGFLERVRFNSNIINVDSAWSSEVDKDAWQIPLWNRQAARERPQVYPMPDIAFVSTAEGDGDKPCVAQDCRDTDHLFFFADFKAGTSDTDQWRPRLGLDYANLPSASAIAIEVDANSSAQPAEDTETGSDNRRRAVSRFLPGLRRFTWRLAPAAQKTAINAGRAGKPVYVGLDSVSFMRAGHVDAAHKALDERLTKALESKGKVPEDLGLGYWQPNGIGAAPDLAAFSKALGDQGDLAQALATGDASRIKTALDAVEIQLKSGIKAKLQEFAGKSKVADITKFKSGITSGALCEKLKNDAVTMIRRKEMLISSTLTDWVSEIDDGLSKIDPSTNPDVSEFFATNKKDVVMKLTALSIKAIQPLFAEASQDVAKIEEGIEKARAVVEDVEVEIDLVIARARQRVEQVNAGYDKNKPWSPDRRKAFRAGIEACISSVADDIAAAIDEAAQRLSTELNSASQSLAGHVAKFLKDVSVVETTFVGKLTSLEKAIDQIAAQLAARLDELDSKASSGQGKLADLIAKATNHPELKKSPDFQKLVVARLVAAQAVVQTGRNKISDVRKLAADADSLVDSSVGDVASAVAKIGQEFRKIGAEVVEALAEVADLDWGQVAADDLKTEITSLQAIVLEHVNDIANVLDKRLAGIGDEIDAVILPATRWLDDTLGKANRELRRIPEAMLPIIDDIRGALAAVQTALAPGSLLQGVVAKLVESALDAVLQPLPETILHPTVVDQVKKQILLARKRLQFFVEELAPHIRKLDAGALGALQDVTNACSAISEGVAEVEAYFEQLAEHAEAYIESKLDNAYKALGKVYEDFAAGGKKVEELISAVKDFDRTVRAIHNDLARVKETAEAYADRVFDAAGKLDDGGLLAAPNNILKLYSAVTSAPELAALKADIDRIRSSFDELGDIIETTKANALFDRLSDELKAIGLSLPFDKIGDSLVPADLRDFNIGSVFRNFGGAKLDKLFKGYRIPDGVRDAVKVTHDFDKKQARAWVQVDINAPFPGRRSLFSLGIFKADFVDMQLTGRVRLEASKDQDKVTLTGFGHIGTAIDVVVGGQSMVRFDKFGLAFTKEKGLDIEFDPKNVRLNPQFKFIQDFLSAIFPELPGGLEWIRENGIPVGVQHDFAIPNLSLNFATSGVSNISLENHFRLVAFPDFMLANRFNLSTVDRPFIFSIFIIGGTGFIQVEAEYKPVRDELTVLVDAGAGGSASLAFAFGPFSGQVFITLSGVLSYRKTLGKPGGGLSISVVLVIAGHVDVAGIVTVGITLMLRMTYRDNGQIDGEGSLSVTIRISKFFKLTARAQVKYKLRGGKSETSVSTSTSAELEDKAKELQKTAKKIQGAMK